MISLLSNKNFLICLAGLPASGKSTFARELKKELEKKFADFKVQIIDPDLIRNVVSGGVFDFKKEQIVRESTLKDVRTALKNGFIVINDDLNYFASMRHDIKKICDDLDLKCFIVYIATPVDVCLDWNKKRGFPIPNDVIEEISRKFDYFNKYNWDTPFAKFDLFKIKDMNKEVFKLVNLIDSTLVELNVEFDQEKRLEKDANLANERLDKITRAIVGNLLRNPNYLSLKNKILEYRKFFIKANSSKSLTESEIAKSFKIYLETNLNAKIL